MDELDENIYKVPPPPRSSQVEEIPPLEPEGPPPPLLMPKKGNSFRTSLAGLDRRVPFSTPKPAPRKQSARVPSVDSLPEKEGDQNSKPSRLLSLDLEISDEIFTPDPNETETHTISQVKPAPQASQRRRVSLNASSRHSTLASSKDSLGTASLQEEKNASPSVASRPKPKPRTKVNTVLEGANSITDQGQHNDKVSQPSVAFSAENSARGAFSEMEGVMNNMNQVDMESDQEKNLTNAFSIPLEADKLESLIDREIDKKYGLKIEKPHNSSLTPVSDSCEKESNALKNDDPFYKCDESYHNVQETTEDVKKISSEVNDVNSVPLPPPASKKPGIFLEGAVLSESIIGDEQQSFPPFPSVDFSTPVTTTESSSISQKGPLKLIDFSDLDPLWQGNAQETSQDLPNENVPLQGNTGEFQYAKAHAPVPPPASTDLYSTISAIENSSEDHYSMVDKPSSSHIVTKPQETLWAGASMWKEPVVPPPPLPRETALNSRPKPPPIPPRPGNAPAVVPKRPPNLPSLPAEPAPSTNIFDDLPTPQFSATSVGIQDPFADSGFDDYCAHFNLRTEHSAAPPQAQVPGPATSITGQALPTPPSPSTKPRELQSGGVGVGKPLDKADVPQVSISVSSSTGQALPTPPSPSTKPKVLQSGDVGIGKPLGKAGMPQVSTPAPSSTGQVLPTPPSPSTKPKVLQSGGVGIGKPLEKADMRAEPGTASPHGAPVSPYDDPDRISKFVPPPPGAHFRGQDPGQGYDLASAVKKKGKHKDDDSDNDSAEEMSPSFDQTGADGMPASIDPRRSLPSAQPQQPKKNVREGLLNKQGGFHANKGWRKRWVVFDGSRLSYYDSNKSQVSKRIIPVECIKNVEIDVKPDSYKFKVITTLKNRVFVFAAEKRDDCTMWANVLMAAVVGNKGNSEHEFQPPQKPDKEGFIRFNNMREYYTTITGQMLRYYQTIDDFQQGSPIHEIDMKLASVKDNNDNKKLKLQLWVHYGHFDLLFPSDQELQQWRLAMEDAIAEGLADDTVLAKVYENMSNQQCADCGADNPHWASINLGIVVCKNCAGVHRMFDFRITRIKSLRMDTRVWTPSLIELMVTIGNANANMFWAGRLHPGEKIQPGEMMERRKDFINRKYIEKNYADKHPLVNLKPALGEELLKVAGEGDVLETMKILFSGADIMYRQDGTGPTAYEIVKEERQRLVMEFLYQNGGDPQSLVESVQDEDRLREDVRLQGFLNKTGPLGKTFERRWCVIEHRALTYYLNEKSTIARGAVERKDMVMVSSVENDRIGYQFELSTTQKDNRTYTFSSDIKDDTGEWMRTIAKLMAPVAVMEHVGMIDIKFAGYAYMKELSDEWHQTFLVFSWRVLNYMNKDLKFDYLDLRKASSIRMQDATNGYQNRGPCFVISSTGRSVYLQANLPRDTEKMYNCLLEAITGSGLTLSDQVLTTNNVPVIVDRCITHVEVHGLREVGVYRKAGQSSRVQALLEEFRRDALAVSLSEYPVEEVANTLKRFLRELEDSVFERINYPGWISVAGCEEVSNRLSTYQYYLNKMPMVNFNTLKRIILHLYQVSEHHEVNKMSIENLASCFAPSLMRTNQDTEQLTGNVCSNEIKIIIDLLENKDFFFHADEQERIRANNIARAQQEIRRIENVRQSVHPGSLNMQSWLVPCQLHDRPDSVNIEVTEARTASKAVEMLMKHRRPLEQGTYVLYETLFNGSLVRPIFPEDVIAKTTNRWMEFDAFLEDIRMSLSVRGIDLLETLDANYNHQSHSLQSELQYSDAKSKKHKTKTVRFKQYQLAIYNKAKDSEAAACWNVEDLTFYLGVWPKRNSPSRHCLTFLVSGEKYTKAFGHCLAFSNEEELYKWAAVLYAVQNPDGLLSWAGVGPS